jgi:NADH:ubiquinone oxidoreductase subunit H
MIPQRLYANHHLIMKIKSYYCFINNNNCRASFPRLRYDQLMSFTWTGMLPLALGFIILVPCILVAFEIA